MTLYAGMNVTLKVRATDGVSSKILTDVSCTVNVYAPGKDPVHSAADRANPDHTVSATYDSSSRYFLASVSTDGWTPGTWTMQGVLSGGAGGYYAFDFETFTLS